MGFRETEETTGKILERLEYTLCSMEQMTFDSINVTDRLVTLTSDARECAAIMREGTEEVRNEAFECMCQIMDQVLEIAFTVNNISHELEKEAVYQRETTDNIKQIVEFLYAMSEEPQE